jgi:hypothetical protein
VALTVRIWWWFGVVRTRLHREPLPLLVTRLGTPRRRSGRHLPPRQLGRYVVRRLRVGPYQSTCLVNALVLYRLLREQGDAAELVIGLPADAVDHTAHAWIELAGVDVGPPPGRGEHVGMARFA